MNSTSNPDSVWIRQLGLAGNGVLHSHPEGSNGNHIRCPCNKKKCQNKNFVEVNEATFHLYKYGFVHNYRVWYLHDEIKSSIYGDEALHNVNVTCHPTITDNVGLLTTLMQLVHSLMLILLRNLQTQQHKIFIIFLMLQTKKYGSVVKRTHGYQPLLECFTSSQSIDCLNNAMMLCVGLLDDNVMIDSFYETKKLVKGIRLSVDKIHTCLN